MTAHILVVEDNPDNCKLVSWILQDAGLRYTCVNSGERCLSYLEQNQTDLVLMDISLPGISGKDAARRIRQASVLAHVPIIALTAYAIEAEFQDILASGMNDILTKPVDEQALLDCLAEHLPSL